MPLDMTGTVEAGAEANHSAEDRVQQQLTAANSRAVKAQTITELMQDPDFAAVWRAKAEGKKVRVIDPDSTDQVSANMPPSETVNQPVDFDNMTEKEKAEYVIKQTMVEVGKTLKQSISEATRPLQDEIKRLSSFAVQKQQQDAADQVQKVKSKYKDFDEYMPKMLGLNEVNPNLDAEQLYILAKTQSGKPIFTSRRTDSERPVNATTPPVQRDEKPLPPGALGLRMAIQGGVDRLKARLNPADMDGMGGGDDE